MSLREQYLQDGVVSGLPVLSTKQAAKCAAIVAQAEAHIEPETQGVIPAWSLAPHPIQRLGLTLARHPRVVGVVRQLLGPHVMLRNIDLFSKAPGGPQRILWHVDTTYPWARSGSMINCWIGLTEATAGNGALQYMHGSHRHVFRSRSGQGLTLSAEQLEELTHYPRVQPTLRAGEMSIHAFRTVHQSANNRTSQRRLGMVLRFFSAHTSPEVAECGSGVLVSGDPGPWSAMCQTAVAVHRTAH